ncbi:MAG TPA: alpha/beta fold hydrolase [Jatrophihabitans sp.]|nr:alpha/beta fold hydrolase [Jatrophihabitans sp.]
MTSADGTRIAVYLSSAASDAHPPDAAAAEGASSGAVSAGAELPTVLAVHGYPDNASVWDQVVQRLAVQCRVLRYDVRGTGCSDKPRSRASYRWQRLAEDARAVLDAYSPERPVHLLAHDWGSVQGWYLVSESAERFASFTSISGPNVAYFRPWIRAKLAAREFGPVLRQVAHSSYIAFFRMPLLPELAWRTGLIDRVLARREPPARRGLPDKLNGLQLYRANLLTRSGPRPRPVRLPVLVIAPTRDAYISPDMAIETPRPFVADLQTRLVAAGHWLPLTHPDYVAAAVRSMIERSWPHRR